MELPRIITVDRENIDSEHICCALGNPKHVAGVSAKKLWMKSRFDEGLVFKKADVNGRALIQYVPAEYAWAPIEAEGYMFIECFWVADELAGRGIGRELLRHCLEDSKKTSGIAVLVGEEKKIYLNDKAFFGKMGFEVCDTAEPYFQLMSLRFNNNAPLPWIKQSAKKPHSGPDKGMLIYYTDGCPYVEYYVVLAENQAKRMGIPFSARKMTTASEARNAPTPFTIHAVFLDGRFICHETLTESIFDKLITR